jgi:hypothetical protein
MMIIMLLVMEHPGLDITFLNTFIFRRIKKEVTSTCNIRTTNSSEDSALKTFLFQRIISFEENSGFNFLKYKMRLL